MEELYGQTVTGEKFNAVTRGMVWVVMWKARGEPLEFTMGLNKSFGVFLNGNGQGSGGFLFLDGGYYKRFKFLGDDTIGILVIPDDAYVYVYPDGVICRADKFEITEIFKIDDLKMRAYWQTMEKYKYVTPTQSSWAEADIDEAAGIMN